MLTPATSNSYTANLLDFALPKIIRSVPSFAEGFKQDELTGMDYITTYPSPATIP